MGVWQGEERPCVKFYQLRYEKGGRLASVRTASVAVVLRELVMRIATFLCMVANCLMIACWYLML